MSEDVQDAKEANGVSLKKEFTLSSGVAVIIGQIIGSGIFITPKSILSHAGSFGACIIMWIVGACVSIAGGLCYIELGLLVKRGGGEFGYLTEAYSFKDRNQWSKLLGSMLGFLFVWSNVCILRPASLGIQALTCARYLTLPFYSSDDEVPESLIKLVALTLIGKYYTLIVLIFRALKGRHVFFIRCYSNLPVLWILQMKNFLLIRKLFYWFYTFLIFTVK